MALSLKWVWELTPRQVFQKNRFVPAAATARIRQERRAFATPKLPLSGTSFTYQLALTSKGQNEESKQLRAKHMDLPESGDTRSGIIILSGDKIIASLILSGIREAQPFTMVVHPEHQGGKLAERLLVEWWSKVRHTYRDSGKQVMSLAGAKVLLNAYRQVVKKAAEDGHTVPDAKLIDTEAEQVLKIASQAEG